MKGRGAPVGIPRKTGNRTPFSYVGMSGVAGTAVGSAFAATDSGEPFTLQLYFGICSALRRQHHTEQICISHLSALLNSFYALLRKPTWSIGNSWSVFCDAWWRLYTMSILRHVIRIFSSNEERAKTVASQLRYDISRMRTDLSICLSNKPKRVAQVDIVTLLGVRGENLEFIQGPGDPFQYQLFPPLSPEAQPVWGIIRTFVLQFRSHLPVVINWAATQQLYREVADPFLGQRPHPFQNLRAPQPVATAPPVVITRRRMHQSDLQILAYSPTTDKVERTQAFVRLLQQSKSSASGAISTKILTALCEGFKQTEPSTATRDILSAQFHAVQNFRDSISKNSRMARKILSELETWLIREIQKSRELEPTDAIAALHLVELATSAPNPFSVAEPDQGEEEEPVTTTRSKSFVPPQVRRSSREEDDRDYLPSKRFIWKEYTEKDVQWARERKERRRRKRQVQADLLDSASSTSSSAPDLGEVSSQTIEDIEDPDSVSEPVIPEAKRRKIQ